MKTRHVLSLVFGAAIALSTAACGTSHSYLVPAVSRVAGSVQTMGVPSQDQFVTIQAVVVKVLPVDNHGLPHQNFVVKDDSGETLTCNNDTKFGQSVPGLKPGVKLTIRGVEYHDSNASGIHWTHHANKPNDAGFIETADGHIYQ